uniref:Putative gag-pol polyprotein n=1 Tax=Ustilago esculenta TaxID=185366 RepID=A0A481SGQ6_9BASI|nr:putative gag-pol polyprotein [Ustilago esculenta]
MEQSFAIKDANGKIRPVTIVKDKIDKKVKYDNIVDQLKAEEIKLGLHKGNNPPKGKPLEEVICFKCKQKGHYANRCPNPQKEEGNETAMIMDVVNPNLAYSSSNNGYGSANNWIIGSASTVHFCINKNLFTELFKTTTPPIQSSSLQHIPACGKGTIKVVANIGYKRTHTLVLKNIFYVPTYAANLIAKVASISINGGRLIVRKRGDIIFKGKTKNMLTYLCQPKPEFAALTYGTVSTSIWHQWLGHPRKGRMKQILEVIPEVAKETDMSSGKCHLVQSDVVGKFKDIMPGGHQFAVTFINDYSRFVMVYLMAHKSEVLGHFQDNIGPTFAQEEEGVGFPYLTQEERDQGISTPPLEDYIHSLSSVAIDDTKGTFTDEAKAIQKELNSHQENNTWTVVDAPNNANIICCQWVFKVKWKGDGTIDKYKARLVAQGYTQVHGFDYKETFTPVVKMATLRMLMIMSLQYDMKIYQLDVITAYLNGELDVNLYMRQPPLPASMMQLGSQSLVCKLNKSLYGLKQAGCTWYQKADSTLTDIGFKQSNYDSTLYYIENKGEPPLILTLYVDDVLIFAKHKPTADKFISTLQSKFKMTGGDPFGLDNTNIVHTPAIASDIANGVALNANDHSLYYIAFAVNHLSCYLASPTDKAMTAAKHLLHYLKGTASYRPLFTKKGTAFPPEED